MAEEKKLSEKLEKMANEIEKLTVLEMSELAKYLEEKLGISAMPAATASTNSGAEAKEQEEEKTSFTVMLTSSGENKLGVIKAVREIKPDLGLMDAKKLVESAPKEILTDVKKEPAEEAKKKIEAAGGKVELK